MVKNAISGGVERLWSKIGDLKDGILDRLTVVKDWIGERVDAVKDTVSGLAVRIRDLFSDLFKFLFVPNENYFSNIFSDLKEKFNAKLPIVSQVGDLLGRVIDGIKGDSTAPSFTITWAGQTVSIINFSFFDKYVGFLRGLILLFAWYFFLSKMYKRIPGFIGGFHK